MLTILGLAEMADDTAAAGASDFFAGEAHGAASGAGFAGRSAAEIRACAAAASASDVLGEIGVATGLALRAFTVAKTAVLSVAVLAGFATVSIAGARFARGGAQA